MALNVMGLMFLCSWFVCSFVSFRCCCCYFQCLLIIDKHRNAPCTMHHTTPLRNGNVFKPFVDLFETERMWECGSITQVICGFEFHINKDLTRYINGMYEKIYRIIYLEKMLRNAYKLTLTIWVEKSAAFSVLCRFVFVFVSPGIKAHIYWCVVQSIICI